MSALNKEIVIKLVKLIVKKFPDPTGIDLEDDGTKNYVYGTDGLIVTFAVSPENKRTLLGLMINLMGTDFIVTEEMALSAMDVETDEVFVVQDERILNLMSEHLEWRTRFLQEIGL